MLKWRKAISVDKHSYYGYCKHENMASAWRINFKFSDMSVFIAAMIEKYAKAITLLIFLPTFSQYFRKCQREIRDHKIIKINLACMNKMYILTKLYPNIFQTLIYAY